MASFLRTVIFESFLRALTRYRYTPDALSDISQVHSYAYLLFLIIGCVDISSLCTNSPAMLYILISTKSAIPHSTCIIGWYPFFAGFGYAYISPFTNSAD